ncbi:MAG: RNA-binding protein [Bacteroidetes bacterium]|nr:RNA-binding protein [Bacteroidota bacterium]
MNIYVGNLSHKASEDEVRDLFSAFGQVSSVKIILDRETRQSRGFAFVEMNNESEANSAMEQLNGTEFLGRELRINEARPREDSRSGGGGGGGYNRGGGGGGGYNRGGGGGRDRW